MSSNDPQELKTKQVFSTGDAAEICKLSQQTIIRCFDSGRLRGFRVPGSRFRRIPREELVRFMKENNIPAEALEGGLEGGEMGGDASHLGRPLSGEQDPPG